MLFAFTSLLYRCVPYFWSSPVVEYVWNVCVSYLCCFAGTRILLQMETFLPISSTLWLQFHGSILRLLSSSTFAIMSCVDIDGYERRLHKGKQTDRFQEVIADECADVGGEYTAIRCCISWTKWIFQLRFVLHFLRHHCHLPCRLLRLRSDWQGSSPVVNRSSSHQTKWVIWHLLYFYVFSLTFVGSSADLVW